MHLMHISSVRLGTLIKPQPNRFTVVIAHIHERLFLHTTLVVVLFVWLALLDIGRGCRHCLSSHILGVYTPLFVRVNVN